MPNKFESSFDRAAELADDLREEYDKCLHAKEVSDLALELTDEVFNKYRSILDRLARQCWEKCISPYLPAEARDKTRVYFPIAKDEASFKSIMGRWRIKDSAESHDDVLSFLESVQPYKAANNRWLVTLNDVAAAGRHIGLILQKRVEEEWTIVKGAGGGSVSWGKGVTFGRGVRVMGAKIDPATQRTVPTPGVEEKREIRVSFMIDGHGVNATVFTRKLDARCRKLVEEVTTKFSL